MENEIKEQYVVVLVLEQRLEQQIAEYSSKNGYSKKKLSDMKKTLKNLRVQKEDLEKQIKGE